jgi:diguanylate cyclase (GGDEF)-like protein
MLVLAAGTAIGVHRLKLLGHHGEMIVLAIGALVIMAFVIIWMAQRIHDEYQARRKFEEELRQSGLHDSLTGLANRTFFMEQLGRRLALAERRPTTYFSVFRLSLQGIDPANPRLPHSAIDRVIMATADSIRACIRATDLAARLSLNEFAILLEELADPRDVNVLAERLLAAIPKAVTQVDSGLAIGASIGIAFPSDRHAHPTDLLRDADAALELAKAGGQGHYRQLSTATAA